MAVGCAKKPKSSSVDEAKVESEKKEILEKKEEVGNMILVGRKAPDFETEAYLNGKFINVKLSNYLGKWVLLCFYPADFTFV